MVRLVVEGIKLKQTEPHGYEFVVGRYDYHIRREGGVWCLDQFRLEEKSADEAHVSSEEVESLKDGVLYAIDEEREAAKDQ